MNKYEQQKIIEVVLYILNKTGGIDFYHLFKIIYFAEMKHLVKWGHRILSDDLCALDYGPVPTMLYDAVKGKNANGTILADLLNQNVRFAGNDAPNVLLPEVPANMNYISKSEVEALDESIAENACLTFGQLKQKSHDKAWYEAYHKENGTNVISPITMLEVMNADESVIEYVKEQFELEGELI
ncbi:MAG: Panacea domain-containing protein [Bacteroidales bacterium]|nr:Panacea domain-containing protein [Bacteroidales bacterium]